MDSLDYTLATFRELLQKGNELILDRFQGLDTAHAYAGLSPEEVRQWFDEPVPQQGMNEMELLDEVKEKVLDTATLNMGPNMYAYVMAGGTQISILAEMLATTINQNVGKWHLAPAISEMEQRVIQWGASFIGYGSGAGGVLVSGGSAANLTGLTVARNVRFESEKIRQKGLFGFKPLIVYASDETHGCIDKSIELLGIGTDHYRKIPPYEDFTINVEALEEQIDQDIRAGLMPFCLIGNAGTVNTGAVDPLEKLAELAGKYRLWFHVDGAYGGLAATTPIAGDLFKGMERADSIAIDFHKWLYQPFEAGCTLVKDWNQLNRTFYKRSPYLSSDTKDDGRFDFNEYYFQLSRNAKALKIWMSFKAYGSDRIKAMIEKDIRLTRYLAQRLEASDDFECCSHPQLGIVCFRFCGSGPHRPDVDTIDRLNREIIPALEQDSRVFITGTTLSGRPVIRACLINHRLQQKNVDFLLQVIKEVGTNLLKDERNYSHTISQ